MLASDARVEVKEVLCGIKKRDKIRFGEVPISSGWDLPIMAIVDCFRSNFVLRVFVREIRYKLSHSENCLQHV